MNHTVLVTGASRGIGKAISRRFAENGDRLILVCRTNKTMLEKLRDEFMEKWGTNCLIFSGDLSKSDTIDELFDLLKTTPASKACHSHTPESAAACRHSPTIDTISDGTAAIDTVRSGVTVDNTAPGSAAACRAATEVSSADFDAASSWLPDIVINCAGISHIGLIQDMSLSQWHELTDTNLTAAFYIIKAAIPGMLARGGGKIINISSVWGCVGASCEAAYSATKGGLNALTMALGKELAPSNIQVNAIACGCIDTEMNAFLGEDERARLIEEIPAGRMGSPEEVAHLAWQLTEGNAYLTGQIIRLDGGWT